MSEDYYSSTGGMVSDGSSRKQSSSGGKKHKVKFRKMTRNVPRTEFGEIMGGLTVGMIFIFPVLAMLAVAFPMQTLAIVLILSFLGWAFSESYYVAILIAGFSVGMIVLGFVSIGIFMAIFN